MQPAGGGTRLAVRLTPKASRERIDGLAREADGAPVLRIAVGAPPEDGKANAALLKLLSKTLKLPKSALEITHGATDRRKTLHIDAPCDAVAARLAPWFEEKA